MTDKPLSITIGSRASKLALKQVEEVQEGIRYHYPQISFMIKCCSSKGDLDQKTSLRDLGQTDFFTYELDQWVLKKKCRIAVHSAKDLPDPLPKGLKVVAITENKNNQDVLVLNEGLTLKTLKKYPKIGTSSVRREQGIVKLIPKVQLQDLRGTIEKRISKVTKGELDGVVIAKVALMRLNLLHLNFLDLPITPPPLQGALAVVALEEDHQMEQIFASIDARKGIKSLYLGLDPKRFLTSGSILHYPMIEISPKPFELISYTFLFNFQDYTHILFTSQSAIEILFQFLDKLGKPRSILNQKKVIAIGQATSQTLMKNGILVDYIAQNESQEGLIELFKNLKLSQNHLVFYPKSNLARPHLIDYFDENQVRYDSPEIYETKSCAKAPYPNLLDFDEIVFTSPSTVKSFFEKFSLPQKKIRFIFKGEVTRNYFNNFELIN